MKMFAFIEDSTGNSELLDSVGACYLSKGMDTTRLALHPGSTSMR